MSSDQDSVSANEAARELNISSRAVRRLAEAGKIRSIRTPGGYVRIRRADLDAYKQSLNLSSVPGVPSRVDSSREEVQTLSLELQQRRLRRDLQRLDEEDAEAERKRGEAVAAQQALSQAALEQARLQREERERQDLEERRKYRWQVWVDEQVESVLMSLQPDMAGRFASEIQSSVEEALQGVDATRPKSIVEPLVRGAVAQVVEPWLREQKRKQEEQERKQLIATAANVARSEVPARFWGTVVESRALEKGFKSIAALPENATFYQMQTVARAAGQRVCQEVTEQEDRERARQKREREVDSYLDHIHPYLLELSKAPEPRGIEFTAGETILDFVLRIKADIKSKLLQDSSLNYFTARQRVRQLVDDWLETELNEGPRN